MQRVGLGAACVALPLLLAIAGCSTTDSATPCHSDVSVGALPGWAGTGFSEGVVLPRAIGHNERIAAIPFSQPLVASNGSTLTNKVLFVSRKPLKGPTPLTIEALLDATGEGEYRVRPEGPGPGTLDLPTPGCWRLTLTWADQADVLNLEYVPPPPREPRVERLVPSFGTGAGAVGPPGGGPPPKS